MAGVIGVYDRDGNTGIGFGKVFHSSGRMKTKDSARPGWGAKPAPWGRAGAVRPIGQTKDQPLASF